MEKEGNRLNRCSWTGEDPLLVEYHDTEWGVPVHDDLKQFEYICLEVMQCGLSWLTVMKKREIFRAAFDGFIPDTVARFDEQRIEQILEIEGMIRSVRKIRAIIGNARAFLKIQEEFGTFSAYLWAFTDNRTMEYEGHADGSVVVASNELSDRVSKDLKKRGFSYIGSITIYAHLQAAGLINDHSETCFRYHQLKKEDR